MKKLIIFLILILPFGAIAQTFNKAYYGNRGSILNFEPSAPSSVLESDTSLVFLSRNPNTGKNLMLRRINNAGVVLDSAYYNFPAVTNFIHLRKTALKKIGATNLGVMMDIVDTNLNYIRLFRINAALDTMNSIVLRDSVHHFEGFDYMVQDSLITVVGQYVEPGTNNQNLLLVQLDTGLNVLWQKRIADIRQPGGVIPYAIKRKANNYYIVGRCAYPNFTEIFILKTDLQGNKIWDKRYRYNGRNSATTCLEIVNNTLFLAAGTRSLDASGNKSHPWFIKLDTAGTILKDSVYAFDATYYVLMSVIKSNSGMLLACGYYLEEDGGFKGDVWKIDQNLNMDFRRTFYINHPWDDGRLYNMHQRSDSSIVCSGVFENYWYKPSSARDHVWVLSLDKHGCFGPNDCGILGLPEVLAPTAQIKLYPNPATTFLTLELGTLNSAKPKEIHVVMYASTGQPVVEVSFTDLQATTHQFELGNIPNGLYTVHITDAAGRVLLQQKITVVK